MSRSNPTPESPVSKWLKWKGSEGKIVSWDKDNQTEVNHDMPFEFLVIEELAAVGGYSESEKTSFYSNEVGSTNDEELVVRLGQQVYAQGFYRDIKDRVKAAGAKYTASVFVYIPAVDQIWNLKFSGASLSQWLDFKKGSDIYHSKIALVDSKSDKKGSVNFFVPVFERVNMTKDENTKAVEADRRLQQYRAKQKAERATQTELTPQVEASPERHEQFGNEVTNEPTPLEDIPPVEDIKAALESIHF